MLCLLRCNTAVAVERYEKRSAGSVRRSRAFRHILDVAVDLKIPFSLRECGFDPFLRHQKLDCA